MEPTTGGDFYGILNLDKPAGPSSARMVARVKRLLPRKTRIGHAGTLDPFATGVLLLLVGRATKQCEALMDSAKQYEATITLGAFTATDDPESAPQPVDVLNIPSQETLANALAEFVGNISQRPPAFSAMKIQGRRAYALARKGQVVQLAARTVRVDKIELLHYEWPQVRVRIDCGRGTYIRSIARDLGQSLGVGGYLTQLRRTRVGAFDAATAVTVEQLEESSLREFLRLPPTIEPTGRL